MSSISWQLEYEGRRKPLDQTRSSELLAMITPLRSHIETALDGADVDDLVIIFSVDEERGLTFTLEGPALTVNVARDRLGRSGEIISRLS